MSGLRRFGSHNSATSADGSGSALAKQSSKDGGIPEEMIKGATQKFDVGIAFKLVLVNRGISRMSGLEGCINLVELNLSSNTISKIEGLEAATQLRKLTLTSNKLTLIEGIWHLSKLETLCLQDNKVAGMESLFLPQLAALPSLRALYLQNFDRTQPNPVCKKAEYKSSVVAALPNLTNLDGERCPASLNYAELSEEASRLRAHPPPKKELVLPEVAPWLQGVPMELTAGPAGEEASQALQLGYEQVIKHIDECEVLHRLLRDEVLPKGREAAATRAQS